MTDVITRDELISICVEAIVNVKQWSDRDSASAHRQVGECWAFLSAGCDFNASHRSSAYATENPDTWWVEIIHPTFDCVEEGCSRCRIGHQDAIACATEKFYLPTRERLTAATQIIRRDWY